MKKFKGKRLLVLGTSVASVEIVEYAKSQGAYVIVTDYLPEDKSKAKKIADETAMISTIDIPALCKFAREKRIDGVFCGVSETNLKSVYKIAKELGLPCYFNKKQWDICQNKKNFKELCGKYGVPVPKDYTFAINNNEIDENLIEFPVIVKPVDSGAGKGVRICNNITEVKEAYNYAIEISPSRTALVEDYIVGNNEITATYTIKNGEISLSCFKDRLLTREKSNVTSQSDILITPSKYIDKYIEEINENVISMFKGIGAKNGVAFLQGIASEKGFVIFEMGYRINGGSDYRLISAENGINYLEMLVSHALTGEMSGFELTMDNPKFSNFILTFNIFAHGGKIGNMCGLDEAKSIPNVLIAEYLHEVGDEIVDDMTLSQRVFRAVIKDNDIDRIKDTILKIQNTIKVEDINGENMLYKPFDVSRMNVYESIKES